MFKKLIFLLYFFSSLVYSQDGKSIRDTILKYQFTNPSKAIDFGVEFTNKMYDAEPTQLIQQTYGLIGEILQNVGLDDLALEYFNQSIKQYQALPDSEKKFPTINYPPWIILNIGNIYLQNRDLDKAYQKYSQAIDLFEKIKDNDIKFIGLNTSYSNIGLIEDLKGNLDKTDSIYFQVYQKRMTRPKHEDILYSLSQLLSVEIRKNELSVAQSRLKEIDTYYVGLSSDLRDKKGSLIRRNYGYSYLVFGAYYQSIKEYDKAIDYLTKSKKIMYDFPDELTSLGSRFAECYLGLNDLNMAEQVAKQNLQIKNLNKKEKKYNYKVLENVYKKKKLDAEIIKIKDSLILLSSSSFSSALANKLGKLEINLNLAESKRLINENKLKSNRQLFAVIIMLTIILLGFLTLKANYNLQLEKTQRLELLNQYFKNEVEKKNRELTSKVNFISQRNEYLKSLKRKISSNSKPENLTLFNINKQLDLVLNSENVYSEFDKMFVNVYPEFYIELNKRFKLSKTDLRLAAYIKMNHSNDEIARISGVSKRTVETQRYRISKKLNLSPEQDLNSFIITL
ncbi:LuxR C-terminal-related transcriptional regulator [Flavobacteriaceae bacterium]|nr:LuxR C-terminal-related transcriptional regulator [Flavobacteriaceae bacterium]